LFQPFTQADGSTTRKFGGTGLGLSISRKLVEMMSGEIWCESTLQQGSTFYFTAWFGIGKETATVDGHGILRQRPGDDTATYDFTGSKILLVEDNEINQQLIVELLRDTGVTVDIANNGQEALEKITVAVTAYDLALMDIQMPVMDGYETTRRIRAEQRFSTLPIIAMTAHAMKEEQQRIAAIGIQGYITKPIDARTTLNIMNRYLWKPGNREASEPGEGAMVVPQRIAPAIPGIDCSGALERLDGNLELYFWVLQSFIDSHASSDDIIRDALNSGNRELAERTAHTVKGVSGVMGAETLQKLALMLENAIHSEVEESTIRDALNRYTGELHTLVRTIALAVQGEAGHEMTASPAEPCPAAIAPVLIRLHQYINGKDGRAERFLDDYRDLFADLPRDHLERLGKCLANFDFEGADASLKVLATLNGITLTPEENETPSW
jgi:CheY-like chemotaxis protein